MNPGLARSLVPLAAVFLFGEGVLARAETLRAVLVELAGDVTIAETSGSPRSRSILPVRRAQYLQILKVGDEIHLPPGAGVGLVCSTDRWVKLVEGEERRLTEHLCRTGKLLPPGTFWRLAPAGGRMRSLKGVLILEGEARGSDEADVRAPLLLSPRNSSVLDGRPTILWTPIPDATEYEVELTGAVRFRIRLQAAEVSCGESWGDLAVCSLPYPAEARELPPGAVSFLSVGARRGPIAPLHKEIELSRVRRLSVDNGKTLRAHVAGLRSLPLDRAARRLLEADLYAREGLLADAISAYREALALGDAPEVRVTLGDAYLKSGLFRLAARSYRELLDRNGDAAVRAAAELGLGRIEYARRSFKTASDHFREARDLYFGLGLKDEGAAAERAFNEARRKRDRRDRRHAASHISPDRVSR